MPAMLRTSKKARKIAYSILGKPNNLVNYGSSSLKNVENKLIRQENSRLR